MLEEGAGGHKEESCCLISMLLPHQGSESGQDCEAESAHLPLGISCSVFWIQCREEAPSAR